MVTNENEPEKVSVARKVFRRVEANSWIISPATCIIVGATVNFKTAIFISCGFSCFWFLVSLRHLRACGGQRYPAALQRDYPKILDVMNLLLWAGLLPISQLAGEDFCRLWVGPIFLGSMLAASLISLAIGKPWMEDAFPLGDDPRMHPIMKGFAKDLTVLLSGVFLIMFASNLIVALCELEVGLPFIIFNFFIPYGALGSFMMILPLCGGKQIWMRNARKIYGEKYWEVLWPEATKTAEESGAQSDDPAQVVGNTT